MTEPTNSDTGDTQTCQRCHRPKVEHFTSGAIPGIWCDANRLLCTYVPPPAAPTSPAPPEGREPQADADGHGEAQQADVKQKLDRLLHLTHLNALGARLDDAERVEGRRLHAELLTALRAAPVQQQEPVEIGCCPLPQHACPLGCPGWTAEDVRRLVARLSAPPAQAAPGEREKALQALAAGWRSDAEALSKASWDDDELTWSDDADAATYNALTECADTLRAALSSPPPRPQRSASRDRD